VNTVPEVYISTTSLVFTQTPREKLRTNFYFLQTY